MVYCTLNDLIDTYGEQDLIKLTDRINKPPTTVGVSLVETAINKACAEIDVHLDARYKLPLPSVPLTLKGIACVLAYLNLHTRVPEDHPAEVAAKRERKLLDGFASGRLSLGLDGGGAPAPINNTVQISPGRNDWARGNF